MGDRLRNYLIGFNELGLQTTELEAHFSVSSGIDKSSKRLILAVKE